MHGRSRTNAPSAGWRTFRPLVAVLAGFLLVSSAAVAAVLLTYNTSSTATLSLKAPPITWAAGPDSSGSGFVASWSLSPNATYYSITLKPVPEANVTWENLTTLQNTDSVSYSSVTVTGSSVSSYAKIQAFRLEFYDYASPGTVAGALDLREASPSLALGSMSAGQKYFVKAYVKLADDTGQQDLPSTVTLSISISP